MLARARGSRMRRMDAHVASALPPPLASRLRMQLNNAPEPSASTRVQVSGGAVAMGKGALVFDGVAISDTSATARRLRTRAPVGPSGDVPGRGQRRTGAMCRVAVAQFTCSMAPSRFEGAARSRARGRCAQPCREHTRRHALGVLVSGAGTGTGTSSLL
jgi:hypothetical protein